MPCLDPHQPRRLVRRNGFQLLRQRVLRRHLFQHFRLEAEVAEQLPGNRVALRMNPGVVERIARIATLIETAGWLIRVAAAHPASPRAVSATCNAKR